jgi:hypothetical protein
MLNTIYNLPTFCKQYYTFTTHHSILPFITFIVFNQNSRHIFVETKTKDMNETIKQLELIKEFYINQGDWTSANQITLAIDVAENYYFTLKQNEQ